MRRLAGGAGTRFPARPGPGLGDRRVVTTAQEWEAFAIVKAILHDTVSADRVFIRDAVQYCAIVLDDNRKRPLCRLRLDRIPNQIGLFDGSRERGGSGALVEKTQDINSLDEIYAHAGQLRETALRDLES